MLLRENTSTVYHAPYACSFCPITRMMVIFTLSFSFLLFYILFSLSFYFYLLVGVVNFSAILSYFQSASWIPFFNVCIFLFFHACADSFSYVLISRK